MSKAAAETIGNIMSPAGGLKALTDAQRAEAVDKVVNAGREQAKKEGTELTEAQRTNLEKLAGEKIDEEAKKAGEAKP